jgi:hypothetical protein
MNTRLKEWTIVAVALAVLMGVFALIHRHNSFQVALDREAVEMILDEMIEIHLESLTENERLAGNYDRKSLKRLIGYYGLRAKQADGEINIRIHMDTPYNFPHRPTQVRYYEMSHDGRGDWTLSPVPSTLSYWFM